MAFENEILAKIYGKFVVDGKIEVILGLVKSDNFEVCLDRY